MLAKRYFSAICAIAKNEDLYLRDWALYHLAIGFDHIFIYDNESRTPVSQVIPDLHEQGLVTSRLWKTTPGRSSQVEAYMHFLSKRRNAVDWLAVIDIDEYINLKRDFHIRDFIGRHGTADAIALNWRMFGSSGAVAYNDKPLPCRFQTASRLSFGANSLRKTIHNLSRTTSIDIHRGTYSPGGPGVVDAAGNVVGNDDSLADGDWCHGVAQINHYFTKSYEEWLAKVRRGYTDATVRPVEHFSFYDRNEDLDNSIRIFCGKLTGNRASAVVDYARSSPSILEMGVVIRTTADDGMLHTQTGRNDGGVLDIDAPAGGVGLYGPYVHLPSGRYAFRVNFRGSGRGCASLDVASGGGHSVASHRFDAGHVGEDGFVQIVHAFPLPIVDLEVRLFCEPGFAAAVSSIDIVPLS